jgi:hypothetical protein
MCAHSCSNRRVLDVQTLHDYVAYSLRYYTIHIILFISISIQQRACARASDATILVIDHEFENES